MSKETLTPETKVLAITWYIPDNWYGTRKRVILSADETTGFATAKEAKAFNSQLRTYVKQKYGISQKPEFKTVSECPDYIYCGAGPSYSCTNIFITPADLEAFRVQYERTEEFRERQQKAEYRRYMKAFRAGRKGLAA
jgi:hypothetical protein